MRTNVCMYVIAQIYVYKKKGFVMVTTLFNTFSQILQTESNLHRVYVNTNGFRTTQLGSHQALKQKRNVFQRDFSIK